MKCKEKSLFCLYVCMFVHNAKLKRFQFLIIVPQLLKKVLLALGLKATQPLLFAADDSPNWLK